MEKTFKVIPINSEFSKNLTPYYVEKYRKYFKNLDCLYSDINKINNNDVAFLFILSGGTEQQALEFTLKNQKKLKMIYIIAHSENNSLPASFEIIAKFKQDNINTKLFFIDNSDIESSFKKIELEVTCLKVNQQLKNSKIGLLGEPSDWLIASSPEHSTIGNNWGPKIIKISMNEFYDKFKQEKNSKNSLNLFNNFTNNAKAITEPSNNEITDTVKVYTCLKKISEQQKLDAITVKCFDIVSTLKNTGCYALSKLNDDGIIAGCEGDLVSTLGMLWVYKMTGQLSWMANPSYFNLKNNTLDLAHCTIPTNMINSYVIRSHYESGIGVAIEGKIPKTNITMVRIGGKNLNKLWAAEGKIISNTNNPNYCRTQVKILFDEQSDLSSLIENPLGNHILLFKGKYSSLLKEYFNNFVI